MEMKELKDACDVCKYIPNDMLELWLDLAAIYSREHWLILQGEFLYRMDKEISKI